jgi:hypothetical protein
MLHWWQTALGRRPLSQGADKVRLGPSRLQLSKAVHEEKARQVTLVAPYLAYLRQDRRFRPGEGITSRTFTRLISSSFDRLVTVDPQPSTRYPASRRSWWDPITIRPTNATRIALARHP